MAEHLLRRCKLAHDFLLPLRGLMLKLFLTSKFYLAFHSANSSGLFKQDGKSFARAVQLAAHGIRGLLGERAYLFIT